MHDADRRQGRLRLHGPTEGRRDCPCTVAEESLDPGSRHRDRPARRAALAATITTSRVSGNAVVALYAPATNFVSAGIRDRKMRRPRGALKQREKLFSLNGQRPLSFSMRSETFGF